VTPDQAREFVARNHQAVMVTLRSGGGLQTSPVTVGIDSDRKVVISSRETAYKVRNLRRRPRLLALRGLPIAMIDQRRNGQLRQHHSPA
jgi:Pyridoxamine 5'-phosphate oxidase